MKIKKTIFNAGYYDSKKYDASDPAYVKWVMMIKRCYDKKYQAENPIYKECSIYRRWKYYSTFANWYHKNFYQIGNEPMELDKDILVKGNKHYSPKTCMFVPKTINNLFSGLKTKNDLPLGVSLVSKKYISRIRINGDIKVLGYFNNPNDAFYAYKEAKEGYIKQVADDYMTKYPNIFPQKLYDAMYNYKIDIDD